MREDTHGHFPGEFGGGARPAASPEYLAAIQKAALAAPLARSVSYAGTPSSAGAVKPTAFVRAVRALKVNPELQTHAHVMQWAAEDENETANVDAGKPAGMQAPVSFQSEAAPSSAAAALLRPAQRASLVGPVPVKAFKDDVRRKIALKRVMPPQNTRKAPAPARQVTTKTAPSDGSGSGSSHPYGAAGQSGSGGGAAEQPSPLPRVPDPSKVSPTPAGGVVVQPDPSRPTPGNKVEVNYRYSGDPKRSCGVCAHFIQPGACEVVAGLIRDVDVCDWFEAGAMSHVVVAQLAHEGGPGSGPQPGQPHPHAGGGGGGFVPREPKGPASGSHMPSEYPAQGVGEKPEPRAPHATAKFSGYDAETEDEESAFDKLKNRLAHRKGVTDPGALAAAIGTKKYGKKGMAAKAKAGRTTEKAPPGWENTVLRMKKHPEITNPFALAAWEKGQGYTPHPKKKGKSSEAFVTAEMA